MLAAGIWLYNDRHSHILRNSTRAAYNDVAFGLHSVRLRDVLAKQFHDELVSKVRLRA